MMDLLLDLTATGLTTLLLTLPLSFSTNLSASSIYAVF